MLCSTWLELSKKRELTLTQLYRVMVESLLKRRWQTENEGHPLNDVSWKTLKGDYYDYLHYMEYLAYLGMASKKIVLEEEQIHEVYKILPKGKYKEIDFFRQLKTLGLLKRYNQSKQAEFVHLTFQEFFAARFIAKAIKVFSQGEKPLLAIDVLKFIKKTKWDEFYEIMWRFVGGILGRSQLEQKQDHAEENNKTVQTFFDLLLQEPRKELEIFELPLLTSCLVEAIMPNIVQLGAMRQSFQYWLKFYFDDYRIELRNTALSKLFEVEKSSKALVEWIILSLELAAPYAGIGKLGFFSKGMQALLESQPKLLEGQPVSLRPLNKRIIDKFIFSC